MISPQLKITYANEFNDYGCHFSGNLAIVDYREIWEDISSRQFLNGFGQGSVFTALEKARAALKEAGVKVKRDCLSIPVLVVEIEPSPDGSA